jgi:hypothetical protein
VPAGGARFIGAECGGERYAVSVTVGEFVVAVADRVPQQGRMHPPGTNRLPADVALGPMKYRLRPAGANDPRFQSMRLGRFPRAIAGFID